MTLGLNANASQSAVASMLMLVSHHITSVPSGSYSQLWVKLKVLSKLQVPPEQQQNSTSTLFFVLLCSQSVASDMRFELFAEGDVKQTSKRQRVINSRYREDYIEPVIYRAIME